MVFRKESKVDAFQRQISALRQQLGNEEGEVAAETADRYYDEPEPEPAPYANASFREREPSYRDTPGAEYPFGASSSYPMDSYEAESSSSAVAIPEVDAQTSVVAHDTIWKGELGSSGSLHVHGVVDGALTAQQDVYIAEEAEVSATITATNVIVAGVVRGAVRCSGRFEVLPRGRVFADVQAPSLIVHEGASVNGSVKMGALAASTAEPATARRPARNRA